MFKIKTPTLNSLTNCLITIQSSLKNSGINFALLFVYNKEGVIMMKLTNLFFRFNNILNMDYSYVSEITFDDLLLKNGNVKYPFVLKFEEFENNSKAKN